MSDISVPTHHGLIDGNAVHSAAYYTSYNELPYASYPITSSCPERLSAIAYLCGLKTAPIVKCRVLDLGCAGGGNLLPIAAYYPKSECVGIDASSRHIAHALRQKRQLGLTNVEFICQDIAGFTRRIGPFDYIIVHGVYSWVPDEVKRAILRFCSHHLAANGIALVSYNCYPGWHFKSAIRQLLRQNDDCHASPDVRLRNATQLLGRMYDAAQQRKSKHQDALRREKTFWDAARTDYLFHEYLGEVNSPSYFEDFVRSAAEAGLQYVAEADPPLTSKQYPHEVGDGGPLSTALLQHEQDFDLRTNRQFRNTLLCSDRITLERSQMKNRVMDLFVSGDPVQSSELDPAGMGTVTFRSRSKSVTSSDAMLQQALSFIGSQWPKRIPCTDVLAHLCEYNAAYAESSPLATMTAALTKLSDLTLKCYAAGLIDLNLSPLKFPATPSNRPVAAPLVRMQARTGNLVSSWLHRIITLSSFERMLITMLDGKWDVDGLARRVNAEQVRWKLRDEQYSELNGDLTVGVAHQIVMRALQNFVRWGLLIREP